MFCAECGTKNETDARFCENCGHKLETTTESTVTVTHKDGKSFLTKIKEMSKKNKVISIVVIMALVVLIATYLILNNMTKPEKIAEKFFNATMSYDVDGVYAFLDVEKSEFTTKEMFKKTLMDEDEDVPKVLNYTVNKALISSDGLSATVTITYVMADENDSETTSVRLVKDKNKKWLFFDNWKVSVSGTDTVKGYQLKVMKDSKVSIEGVEVDKKYIDKEKSSASLDVYSMPAMFATYYDIVITLPIGVEIEDEMYVSKGSSYTYKLSLGKLSKEVKNQIENAVKTNLQTLYNGVKDKKSFDDVKSSFDYEGADLKDLQDAYEDLASHISSDITLTKVDFKDITLSSVSVDDDGNLYVYAKASYDYSLTYLSGEEMKTHDSSDSDYVYLTFDYVGSTFKLINASSLKNSFSKYY